MNRGETEACFKDRKEHSLGGAGGGNYRTTVSLVWVQIQGEAEGMREGAGEIRGVGRSGWDRWG